MTAAARLLGVRVVLLLVLLAVGCGGDEADTSESASAAPAEAEPKRGGTLRVAVFSDHSTVDPTKALATPDILVIRQAYDNLILLDPDDLSLNTAAGAILGIERRPHVVHVSLTPRREAASRSWGADKASRSCVIVM